LSNSEQRDSWLNSSHWTLDANNTDGEGKDMKKKEKRDRTKIEINGKIPWDKES